MTPNQFLAHKFSGNPLRAWLKLIYWNLFRRPHADRLGVDTYLMPNFRCTAPHCLTIGQRVLIGRNARFEMLTRYLDQSFNPRVEIGDDVYIGSNCEIVCSNRVDIGAGSVLSDGIYVNDTSHGLLPSETLIMDRPLVTKGPVTVGAGCFIGRNTMIISGVSIGDHCVIGAGSVVTRSIPDYSLAAGNPARVISRFELAKGAWIRVD